MGYMRCENVMKKDDIVECGDLIDYYDLVFRLTKCFLCVYRYLAVFICLLQSYLSLRVVVDRFIW